MSGPVSLPSTFNYPVATFCGACGQPVHQDNPPGWDPRTPCKMYCANPACETHQRRFIFTPVQQVHTWAA